tara:strand:+ start:59 stop:481 length:423 start_codon:yes stop_codon:yes gene_type:complete
MGGSTKKVEETVKRSDLGRAGAAVQDKGSEAIEYTKQKGTEIAEGAKQHGGALATGLSKGMQGMGDMVVGGLKHNLGELAKIVHGPGSGSGDSGSQSASANYSQQGKRSRSGAQKKGDLQSQERKGATGKQKLYARRKTA